MKGYLILEDGTVYSGEAIGAKRTVVTEIVFNTSMTGYLEVLTDPSYAGQAITMTYPLIGNYGITPDMESKKVWADGFIVHELSRTASNFRSKGKIQDFLWEQNVPGIAGIDTRSLVQRLREKGTMNGMITNADEFSPNGSADESGAGGLPGTAGENIKSNLDLIYEKLREYEVGDVVSKVTCQEKTVMPNSDKRVALLDLGAKNNIEHSLHERGCEVMIFPADTTANEILSEHPDGIMLSNGPGDPKTCGKIINEIKLLYESGIPTFAICLGHQLMALANGADTYKMKYGHRGGNHPVKDLATGRVYITSQNHGYVVDDNSLAKEIAEPAFVNVNDGTNEGLIYKKKPVFTVQFHPEACPGPLDSGYLFDRFLQMMDEKRKGAIGNAP